MKIKNADAVVKFLIDLSNKDAIKGVTELEKKSEALSKKFNKAGKALTVGLTTPIVAFGTYGVKAATDFNKASNTIQTSLGLTNKEAKEYDNIMRDIYNANYGESFEDVASAISVASQELYEFTPEQIKEVTENALALRDTFSVDVSESIRASKALITQFGVSAEEAYNLIAQGAQNGLDFSGELIDNINEYSVQFKKLGLSAEDMFNIFQSGADAGAWNLDKIGDAVKEFSIRAIDGSNTTIDGFQKLGLNADKMAKKFASGGDTAKQAFYETIDAIKAMDDPVKQSIVGVDLFGTMWEDLGPEVVTQLGSIREGYDKTNDSMNQIKEVKYDDLGSMIEEIKRQFGDIALTLGNDLMPHLTSFAGKIKDIIGKFKELSPETQSLIFKFLGIAATIGPTLIIVGKFISMITRLNKALGILKGAKAMTDVVSGFTKLGGSYSGLAKIISLLSGPAGIVLAIGAIIGAVVLLYNKCEWFRNGVNSLVSNIVSVIQSIAQTIVSVGLSIWNFLQPIFNFIKSAIILNIAIVSIVVQSIFSILATIGSWIYKNVLSPVIKFFSSAFSFIWGSIVSPLIEKIKFGFNFIVGFVKSVFSNIKSFLGNIFGSIVGIIKSPINGVISAINRVLKSMNKIKIPDWVPGLGGKHPSFGMIPKLNTGTNYVAGEGLAYLHEGEAVVPKKYNPAVGGYSNQNQPIYINVSADMDVNKFGKAFVRDIKTFSGGTKNSYNYGGGK